MILNFLKSNYENLYFVYISLFDNCYESQNDSEQQDPSAISLEEDGRKQKTEQNITSNSRGKQSGKQAKENSDSGDAAKDSYIHVRAKRGQATNSHSLAERVKSSLTSIWIMKTKICSTLKSKWSHEFFVCR